MSWVNLDNLTRFYTKLKEKMYLKTEIDTKLSDKANSSHTHDDRYYTESEINSKISTLNSNISNASLKMVLLWTNASPGSGFNGQKISLDLSKYILIGIKYKNHAYNGTYSSIIFHEKNTTTEYSATHIDQKYFTRQVTNISNTGVTFGGAYAWDGGGRVDNTCAIPYQIYGVK